MFVEDGVLVEDTVRWATEAGQAVGDGYRACNKALEVCSYDTLADMASSDFVARGDYFASTIGAKREIFSQDFFSKAVNLGLFGISYPGTTFNLVGQ